MKLSLFAAAAMIASTQAIKFDHVDNYNTLAETESENIISTLQSMFGLSPGAAAKAEDHFNGAATAEKIG